MIGTLVVTNFDNTWAKDKTREPKSIILKTTNFLHKKTIANKENTPIN